MKTKAIRKGDHYVINGQKTFLTNAQQANLIVVVVKTDPTESAKGISLVVVETDAVEGNGGFTRGSNMEKIGQKAADTSEVFFDDVEVPLSNLLGTTEGKGFAQLMEQLPQERLIVAAGACVAMEMALKYTSEYVKQRKAFGKRILDFQNTQFRLAERYTEAKIARVFVDDCAMKLAEGKLDSTTWPWSSGGLPRNNAKLSMSAYNLLAATVICWNTLLPGCTPICVSRKSMVAVMKS